jgi:purine-binding chemotaxis protein CheW
MVDAVNEVLDISPADIEPPPAFGARVRSEFIHGMGKVKGKFVILLDVNNALSIDEIGALAAVPAETPAEPARLVAPAMATA